MISSSQNDTFGFDDSFFGAFDGLEIGEGVGDDVVRELGEGWGGAALENQVECVLFWQAGILLKYPSHDMQTDEPIDFGFNDADNMYFEQDVPIGDDGALEQNVLPLPPLAFATPQGTQRGSAGMMHCSILTIILYKNLKLAFLPLPPSLDTPSNPILVL